MKKLIYLFSLLCACSNTPKEQNIVEPDGNGLPKFAHERLSAIHGTQDYAIINDDTITIPVRQLMAASVVLSTTNYELTEEYYAAKNNKERKQAIEKAEKVQDEYYQKLITLGTYIDYPRYDTKYDYDQYRVIETCANYKTIKIHIRVGTEEISETAANPRELFIKAYESYKELCRDISNKKQSLNL